MEWVKCSDRLPELNKKVIILCDESDDMYVARLIFNPPNEELKHLPWHDQEGWYNWQGEFNGCCVSDGFEPIYWMPLPLPPKDQ